MRPVLFHLGALEVGSAAVFAGLAALSSFFYLRGAKSELGLNDEDFWGLMLALIFGTFAGAVLAYALLYGPGFAGNVRAGWLRGKPAGGSFFGAAGGAALLSWAYCRRRRLDFAAFADRLGAAVPLGLILMRVGCLLNGCCYGKPTSAPWGIAFTDPFARVPRELRGLALHPSQSYEIMGAAALFSFAHLLALPAVRERRWRPGSAGILSAALYCCLRFGTDFFRGSDPGLLVLGGLSTAQLAALLCLAGFAALALRPAARGGSR